MDLVLGSSSRYRRELLARLTTTFRVMSPDVDETPLPNELPRDLAIRLANAKARAVADRCEGAIVIGSDQVADLDGDALGKPGTIDNAIRQLTACSGRIVVFHTAMSVIDRRTAVWKTFDVIDTTRVKFRNLDRDEIARYVELEKPIDCAGSFKSEGIGIALFESIETIDPTGLVGLPMIALCELLRHVGVNVL
ncbi:MAG: Maf family nucleotide pyrophosphatase [Rudaea sp.]